MKKLYMMLIVMVLSIAMLIATVIPVSAESSDNKPVSWVSSFNNSNNEALPEMHGGHKILVKLLSDGTTVGHVKVWDRITKMTLVSNGFDQTPGKTHFWEEDGAKIVEFIAFIEVCPESPPPYINAIKYQIWDYGEPGENDIHHVWVSFDGGSSFVPFSPPEGLPYYAGHAKVHIGD
jgi:hypothetical protein